MDMQAWANKKILQRQYIIENDNKQLETKIDKSNKDLLQRFHWG